MPPKSAQESAAHAPTSANQQAAVDNRANQLNSQNTAYHQSRGAEPTQARDQAKSAITSNQQKARDAK
jgi:hypothetical protein